MSQDKNPLDLSDVLVEIGEIIPWPTGCFTMFSFVWGFVTGIISTFLGYGLLGVFLVFLLSFVLLVFIAPVFFDKEQV